MIKIIIRVILPMIILIFTNLRLACLIQRKENIPHYEHYYHNHHRIYTLLAIVFFFVFINVPGLILNIWDMTQFKRINACQDYSAKYKPDIYFGYSTKNIFMSEISNSILSWCENPFKQNIFFIFSVNFLNVLNSTINFIFYVIFAPRFRRKLVRMWRNFRCLSRNQTEDDNYKSIFYVSNFYNWVKTNGNI